LCFGHIQIYKKTFKKLPLSTRVIGCLTLHQTKKAEHYCSAFLIFYELL